MNTKDYVIPQNRERVYFVGTKEEFEWPNKVKMDDIRNYVDWEDKKYQQIPKYANKKLYKVNQNAFFINIEWLYVSKFPSAHIFSPCLMARSNDLWCFKKHRFANYKEFLLLQGFSTNFIQVVSSNQIKKQIGNSMSVNVVKVILKNLIIE